MDKEDCIQVLLVALQQPEWKLTTSVTDWDLKNVLWRAGLLLTPEQVAALFADMKRRGFISASERRSEGRVVALWGTRITPAGVDWLAQRPQVADCSRTPSDPSEASIPPQQKGTAEEGVEMDQPSEETREQGTHVVSSF